MTFIVATAHHFIHYGPFENEDEARQYAQIVGGAAHELVEPVFA